MTEEMQVARPKCVPRPEQDPTAHPTVQAVMGPQPEKRGPGRPSIADPFDVLRQVAALLKTTDKNSRRMILETLRDLTE
jgi:hypothetical protein